MKFSSRMRHVSVSPSLAMLDQVSELRAAGRKIINFGTRPDAPQAAKEAAKSYLDAGAASPYTPTRGLRALRVAVAQKLAAENSLQVDPDRDVVVTIGAKQGVYAALLTLVGAGDEVLVEGPGWLGFAPIVKLTGATPVPLPVDESNAFQIDINDIRARVSPRTRVLLLCNPHNPTGAVLSRAELEAIARLACENDLAVVVDEAYERLIYGAGEHVTLATLDGMWERTITVQTCSKIYNMGGWRVGWVAGPAAAIERIEALQSSAITCPTSFAQAGVAAALGQPLGMGDQPIGELLDRFSRQRDVVVNGLRAIPGVTCVDPSGGFFTFPNFSSFRMSSVDLCAYLLEDASIATTPGAAFGAHGEGHLRVLYTSPVDEIRAGLEAMADSLDRLRKRDPIVAGQ